MKTTSAYRLPGAVLAAAAMLWAAGAARAREGATPPPALVLQEYEGYHGVWLTNAVAEAFVIGDPYPRVAAFRLRGGESLLRLAPADPYFGVATWYKEPRHTTTSGTPANQPAELSRPSPREALLIARTDEKSGLQVRMAVTLDPSRPRLLVRHGIVNHGDADRTLAVWAVTALPRRGLAMMPFPPTREEPTGSLLIWSGTELNQPGIGVGARGVVLDLGTPFRGPLVRLGVPGEAGWTAYERDGVLLRSGVGIDSGAAYPEGGATAALYAAGGTGELATMENVGPLKVLTPGATLWLEQELVLYPKTALPASLGDARIGAAVDRMLKDDRRR